MENIKKLDIGEHEGPLIIDKPCILDGSMSTLWASEGPVLIVKSSGVTIKNIRIEVTGDENNVNNYFAVDTEFSDLIFENTEVKGNIRGLLSEPEKWSLPSVISLGEFSADTENNFTSEIISADDAEIINNINSVEIYPETLKKGKNIIQIKINPMKDNTILYGEIFIKSRVMRRIYLSGKAVSSAPKHNDKINNNNNNNTINTNDVEIINNDFQILRKGQRLSIGQYANENIKFVFSKDSLNKNMDIDGYVFMLNENGKAVKDEDLVFFSNPESSDGSTKVENKDGNPVITVNPSKVNAKYQKIAICLSIYGEDKSLNFYSVKSPVIKIFSNENQIYEFRLENLSLEKTVVCIEIYHYKNEWKINCIGSGYTNGLKKLCESYGIEIED
ncbi:MAG: TerD family protein [Oscillospiraceae bacterium]|nr:TerD family protein [Oscillospiraceae bacterium]